MKLCVKNDACIQRIFGSNSYYLTHYIFYYVYVHILDSNRGGMYGSIDRPFYTYENTDYKKESFPGLSKKSLIALFFNSQAVKYYLLVKKQI